jgi:sugar lactone lactonase YvrE
MTIELPLRSALLRHNFAPRLAAGCAALAALVAMPSAANAQTNYATPYTFTTFAGTPFVPGGADGTGAAAQFNAPYSTAVDTSGNIYVADLGNDTIRKITPGGVVTTLAGTAGLKGSADGTGAAARFNTPVGVAVDSSGNVYVSDEANETIRMITPGGVVTTLAGTPGMSGTQNGTGSAATFSTPSGIAVDGSGNLYVADQTDDTIRKIAPGGVVTTYAGTANTSGFTDGNATTVARFNSPFGVAVDGSGNVYVADSRNLIIRMITPAGVVSTIAGTAKVSGTVNGTGPAAQFTNPISISVDGNGNLYVADQNGDASIRKIAPGGVVTTLAGKTGFNGYVDGTGTAAEFDAPWGVGVDTAGNVYVGDTNNNLIRKVTPGGVVTTIAGTPGSGNANGTGTAARFNITVGVAVDGNGNLYVADEDNDLIRKITPSGVVTTLAGSPGNAGSADGTGSAAQFNFPAGLTVDGAGNVFVSDTGSNTIRKITPAGAVTTVAGTPGTSGSANGTGSAALFDIPIGIVVDGNDNLYVCERGNQTIRKITSGGVVTTLAGQAGSNGSADGTGSAARFNLPAGITIDGNGNLFVTDATNALIREVTPAGVVTTIAGLAGNPGSADGTGSAARFFFPVGISADVNGNLFVADNTNDTIRRVTQAGVVTTIGGIPSIFGSTDGTGPSALFNNPEGIAVDSLGNVWVGDTLNDTIRKGTLSGSPQIITQPSPHFSSLGGSVTFSVSAAGGSALTYQWNFNSAAIAGATSSSYTIASVQASDAGTYTVTITDADGSITSAGANLTVNSGAATTRLINISTRALVGTGGNILIPGFVITGSGTETLLIRGDGPSLSQFNVAGVLAQPTLSVFSGSTQIATNTGWGTNTNPAQIVSTAAQVGAFAFSAGSADCALIVNLTAGNYTVQISGLNSSTGVALAEVYEVNSTGTRLVNISTRAMVGTGGNILIPGFVISGPGSEQLLVRADGPSLAQFNVTGILAQTTLGVYSGSTVIASNTGWGTSTESALIASTAAQVGAFAFSPNSGDSAQIVNLTAGAYTIQISGVNNTTGVALAEIYEVQ